MFSIDRFDPAQQLVDDKKKKLATLNARFKRKRTSKPETPVIDTTQNSKPTKHDDDPVAPVETIRPPNGDVPSADVQPVIKKPHREKQRKNKIRIDTTIEEFETPEKVAHIIKTFHKYQDRSTAAKDDVESTGKEDNVLVADPVADLVPVPQPTKSSTKRQTVAANAGLPQYLQHPNVIATSLSKSFKELPLSQKLQDNLHKCEFENAFAVQAALLPVLLARHLPEDRKDILVSAPTGSGKTLTYALPILQTLQTRRITRLRALIIVPTRELVQQVQSTFESLSSKLGLKIEITSSNRPFPLEQNLLVNDYEPLAPSNVDILICTPGRLVDHIKSTPRFTLQDLRFLVIDEGDRLLNQSFQGWSAEIDLALKPLKDSEEADSLDLFTSKSAERCQKLIFSATMSTDPSLLAQLNLVKPALYLVQDRSETDTHDLDGQDIVSKFTTPATLSEYFIYVPDEIPKPLVLLNLIHRMSISQALIFTNSNESAQKLTTLMSLLDIGRCEAFTSTLTPALRRRHLADFASSTRHADEAPSEIRFLVCSDLMARGIDSSVYTVINYDSSISTRSYVHRVGRTARAGKEGQAMSLVTAEETKYWWRQIGGRKIRRSKDVVRITLFPKDAAKNPSAVDDLAMEDDAVVQHDDDEDMDGDDDGDDGDKDSDQDDKIASDKDSDEEDEDEVADKSNPQKSKDARLERVQVPLKDVDQAGLKTLYETALMTLRNR